MSMKNNNDSVVQDVATVTGVFVVICGLVLAIAGATPNQPEPEPPAGLIEIGKHADAVSAAIEDKDYEGAKAEIGELCTKAAALSGEGGASTGQPVTLSD
jgi:hypothetical protein